MVRVAVAAHGSRPMGRTWMRRCLVVLFLCALSAAAQSNDGELRLKVTDPSGLGVKCTVELLSEANQYRNELTTDADGTLSAKRLPYGIYQVRILREGFASGTPCAPASAISSPRAFGSPGEASTAVDCRSILRVPIRMRSRNTVNRL
jgi:hypothetical protein